MRLPEHAQLHLVVDHHLTLLVDDLEAQQRVAALPVDLDQAEVVATVHDGDTMPIALHHAVHVLGPVQELEVRS